MARRIGQARRADQPDRCFGTKRTAAAGAGRLAGDCQLAPAGRAQPGLGGEAIAAQRATRRKDQIDNRGQKRMNLHFAGIACMAGRGKAGLGTVSQPAPPRIFSPQRRLAQRRRALRLQQLPGAARYVLDDMVEDVTERIGFLRHVPRRVLAIGDLGALGLALAGPEVEVTGTDPAAGLDLEAPYPFGDFDTAVSLNVLDTANDLPGALIHLRNALAPGGLAVASFIGAGSLQALRAAMLEADGERPAPRLHPMVDVRAGGQLLQRAGWGDPVVDSRTLSVRYSGLDSLVTDLRAQGLSNCLTNPGPPLSKQQFAIVKEQFAAGRTETFEILTLTGWRK